MAAQPVDRQHAQREQNPLAQVGNPEDVRKFLDHLLQNLKLAAGFGDFLLRRLGKLVRMYGQSDGKFAIAEYLDWILGAESPPPCATPRA